MTEPQRQDISPRRWHVTARRAAAVGTGAAGAALTWLFCQGYLWKISHQPDPPGRLFWGPASLVTITVAEFALLGAFIARAVLAAGHLTDLVWVIVLLFALNVVLTVAMFGFPAY